MDEGVERGVGVGALREEEEDALELGDGQGAAAVAVDEIFSDLSKRAIKTRQRAL